MKSFNMFVLLTILAVACGFMVSSVHGEYNEETKENLSLKTDTDPEMLEGDVSFDPKGAVYQGKTKFEAASDHTISSAHDKDNKKIKENLSLKTDKDAESSEGDVSADPSGAEYRGKTKENHAPDGTRRDVQLDEKVDGSNDLSAKVSNVDGSKIPAKSAARKDLQTSAKATYLYCNYYRYSRTCWSYNRRLRYIHWRTYSGHCAGRFSVFRNYVCIYPRSYGCCAYVTAYGY